MNAETVRCVFLFREIQFINQFGPFIFFLLLFLFLLLQGLQIKSALIIPNV